MTVTGAVLTTAYADSGSIRFNVIKAGFVVGGSDGSGTLLFHGRRYALTDLGSGSAFGLDAASGVQA